MNSNLYATWSRITDFAALLVASPPPSNHVELVIPGGFRAPARIAAIRDESNHDRTLTLDVGKYFPHHGVGATVAVTSTLDGHLVTRTYPISSRPERRDGTIDITIGWSDSEGLSRYLAEDAAIDEYLTVAPPREGTGPACCRA